MSRDPLSSYYDAGGIEVLDIVKAKLTSEQYIGYLLGTAMVYHARMMYKDKENPKSMVRDARKAANYAIYLAEYLEQKEKESKPIRLGP